MAMSRCNFYVEKLRHKNKMQSNLRSRVQKPRNYVTYCHYEWAGRLSRYSDWLGAGRSGIESRWGRDFPPIQTGHVAHPASCKMGTGSFPGVKCGRGLVLTTHPLLVPRRVELYLYQPSGPHRASNGITLRLLTVTTNRPAATSTNNNAFFPPWTVTNLRMFLAQYRSKCVTGV